jgi:hypothetical protein
MRLKKNYEIVFLTTEISSSEKSTLSKKIYLFIKDNYFINK